LQVIARSVRDGYTAIYDADLQGYFDSIPHDKLLLCVARRVADRSVLRLLRQWLQAPVEERDEDGRPTRRRPIQGTPQGGVISPLLANLYLHWFDVVFHRRSGPGQWAQARLVRYADDFVIVAKTISSRLTGWVEATVEGWLGLTMNREKTRIVRLTPESGESLTFLGYTFRYDEDRYGRNLRYFTAVPSARALARIKDKVRALVTRRQNYVPVPVLIGVLNRRLDGWKQAYRFGRPRRAQRALNAFTIARLTHHLQRRSQRPWRLPAGMTWYGFITGPLGLKLL
jgi:RNA-directed DNA polymerase